MRLYEMHIIFIEFLPFITSSLLENTTLIMEKGSFFFRIKLAPHQPVEMTGHFQTVLILNIVTLTFYNHGEMKAVLNQTLIISDIFVNLSWVICWTPNPFLKTFTLLLPPVIFNTNVAQATRAAGQRHGGPHSGRRSPSVSSFAFFLGTSCQNVKESTRSAPLYAAKNPPIQDLTKSDGNTG